MAGMLGMAWTGRHPATAAHHDIVRTPCRLRHRPSRFNAQVIRLAGQVRRSLHVVVRRRAFHLRAAANQDDPSGRQDKMPDRERAALVTSTKGRLAPWHVLPFLQVSRLCGLEAADTICKVGVLLADGAWSIGWDAQTCGLW